MRRGQVGTMPARGSITVALGCSFNTASNSCIDLTMFGAHNSRYVTILADMRQNSFATPFEAQDPCSVGLTCDHGSGRDHGRGCEPSIGSTQGHAAPA